MRSRRPDVEAAAAVHRALSRGVCGMGEPVDERAQRRLERFAALPDGTFVWTRDGDGRTYVGRLTGPCRHDPEGLAVDLVHVRDTEWAAEAVDAALVPAAVRQTFARGGRNLQRIHPGEVEAETQQLWQRLGR
jgi:hypothetical protein